MQVGDRVIERPMHANQLVSMKKGCGETHEEAEGRIVYIHPDERFYTVEFQTRGGPVRESFWHLSNTARKLELQRRARSKNPAAVHERSGRRWSEKTWEKLGNDKALQEQ